MTKKVTIKNLDQPWVIKILDERKTPMKEDQKDEGNPPLNKEEKTSHQEVDDAQCIKKDLMGTFF